MMIWGLGLLNTRSTGGHNSNGFAGAEQGANIFIVTRMQRGFALVELMIALIIGSLVVLAISTLFFQVVTGYRMTDDTARSTESGTFGLRMLTEDLRVSGFVGLFDDAARVGVSRPGLVSGAAADNCGHSEWFLPLDPATQNVRTIEHFSIPSALPCIPAASHVAGSPAIVVRGATGVQATPADMLSNRIYLQSSQSGAIVFRGVDYASEVKAADRQMRVCRYTPGAGACVDSADDPPCRCPKTGVNAGKGSVALVDGPIFQYHTHIYYIRPCSRPAGATCTSADDGGEPVPTLVRRQLSEASPASFVETPIAEGVERMAISYGLDTDGNNVVDTYTDQNTAFTPGNPNLSENALTVRVSLLMRTRKADTDRSVENLETNATYTLADGSTFNCATNGASCRHRRYLLTDTVQVKNNVLR